MSNLQQSLQQMEFDKTYITGNEIAGVMGVTKQAIGQAHLRGDLPQPIILKGSKTNLWFRNEITTYLDNWRQRRQARFGIK